MTIIKIFSDIIIVVLSAYGSCTDSLYQYIFSNSKESLNVTCTWSEAVHRGFTDFHISSNINLYPEVHNTNIVLINHHDVTHIICFFVIHIYIHIYINQIEWVTLLYLLPLT